MAKVSPAGSGDCAWKGSITDCHCCCCCGHQAAFGKELLAESANDPKGGGDVRLVSPFSGAWRVRGGASKSLKNHNLTHAHLPPTSAPASEVMC